MCNPPGRGGRLLHCNFDTDACVRLQRGAARSGIHAATDYRVEQLVKGHFTPSHTCVTAEMARYG
jgi:hypothetical protein